MKTVIPEEKGPVCLTAGCSKRRNFFLRHILIIQPFVHMGPCSWAIEICKNVLIRTYVGLVTVDSVEMLRYFAFLRHGLWIKLAIFCIATLKCIFRRIFGADENSGNFVFRGAWVTRFLRNPPDTLLYTIITPEERVIT